MAKKVLITGVTGFAGSFLAEHLLKNGDYDILGTYLSDDSLSNVDSIRGKIRLEKLDLTDASKISSLFSSRAFDYVFHLAALSSPGDSFKDPTHTITNNVEAQIRILEALRNSPKTRVLIISSADVYGVVSKEDLPIQEKTQFRPINPYAVSKIAQDFLGLQYFLSYKMSIVRVRPFNHIGPRQSPNFVVSSFAKKIAEIEKGKRENVLLVGNLSPKRDFTDVRDMVAAYSLILEKGEPGEVYNIGSGKSYTIEDVVNKLLSFSSTKITVKIDPSLVRVVDEPELRCDSSKMQRVTGWKTEILIEKSLRDTLDYWREIV